MYVEILYPDDNSIYMVAVYEKENNKRYTIDEIRKKDKFNGYYKEDNRLIGFWKTVDFIKIGQKFNYKIRRSVEEFELQRLTINPDDNTVMIFIKNKEPQISKYTQNYILNLVAPDTMCNYTYEKINGKEYIIVEWKNDDYIYGEKLYGYYVLEKMGGSFMEKVFERKEKIYSILSDEKCGLLLGKDMYLPKDKRGNVNTLIVAGSGAGKSAAFTIPNVLNMLGNYVITDPWGEIYDRTHEYLEKNGYTVKTINYEEGKNNYKYNPLNHIKNDSDIDVLTDILVGNEDDEFWNESCKCLMKTILYYVMEEEEKKDLLTCFKLVSLSKDKLFEKLDCFAEESKISKYYSILKTFPEKTYASIVSTTIMKLAFVINEIPENREYNETFDFTDVANNSKIAIFLICKQENKEDKKLINIFISQFLSQLTKFNTGKEYIYLLLDEVGMFGKIYELPRNMESAKARKISISLLTNNLSKLNKIYGDDFYTIINSIDTQLFLGTMLKADIDYFSDISGLDNEFIKNDLVRDKLLICEKGLKPIIAEKQYFFRNEEWKEFFKSMGCYDIRY